jgi:hypothetical protein
VLAASNPRGHMKALIFIAFLFTTSLSAFGSNFALTSSHHISKFLGEITDILPQELKNKLDRKIEIKFKQIDNVTKINPKDLCELSTDSTKYHFGYIHKSFFGSYSDVSTIYIHKAFKEIISQGEQSSTKLKCRAKNMYRFAQSIIIHELAHLYDLGTRKDKNTDLKFLNRCTQFLGTSCIANNIKSRVSDSVEYLYISGFSLKKNTSYNEEDEEEESYFSTKKKINLILRSPDPYEYTNQYEHFAVNVPLFLMDSHYKCRRPVMYNFFAKEFKIRPFQSVTCSSQKMIKITSSSKNKISAIDINRIYQIHYLLAGKGHNMMSKWGHAMFRIIQCAPYRKEVGPECMKDIQYHLVVSFVADVSNLSVNTWKGLSGKYPSVLSLSSLQNIILQYNEVEFRNLYSYPLELSKQQIKTFLNLTITKHWEYSGKYYFLSNNCATESLDLLKGVFTNHLKLLSSEIITPTELRDLLINYGIIQQSILEDNNSLYFFRSKYNQYEEKFYLLKEKYNLTITMEEFLESDLSIISKQIFKSDNLSDLHALYMLAKIALRRRMDKFQAYIIENKEKFKDQIQRMIDLNKQGKLILTKGYGIPTREEIYQRQVVEDREINTKQVKEWIKSDVKAQELYDNYLNIANILTTNKVLLKRLLTTRRKK